MIGPSTAGVTGRGWVTQIGESRVVDGDRAAGRDIGTGAVYEKRNTSIRARIEFTQAQEQETWKERGDSKLTRKECR